MMRPPLPADEGGRLAVLERSCLLNVGPDAQLDAMVIATARAFRAPMAAVSLVSASHQHFVARVGLDAARTDRECSICAHLLFSPSPLTVLDCTKDARFSDNPLVNDNPFIRFYAGSPLFVDGRCVGALCVLDHRSRSVFLPAEVRVLQGLAFAVESRLRSLAVEQIVLTT